MSGPPAGEREGGGGAERLPPGGSWARLYALVLAAFAIDLLLLWWFTERYR